MHVSLPQKATCPVTTPNRPQGLYNYIARELPFIRPIYRTLLSRRRTYAAFEVTQLETVLAKLAPTGPILDPMSGYGVLSEVCRSINIPTCCMEVNPPSYLWQIFSEPNNKNGLLLAVQALAEASRRGRTSKEFEASDSWFPNESILIIQNIWKKALNHLKNDLTAHNAEKCVAAILLPFLGRLSSCSEGTINIQVKKGGIVFFKDWQLDFKKYLALISDTIFKNYEISQTKNEILLLDALEEYKISKKYSFIITSPPYPNMRDFYTFFFPENYAIESIIDQNIFSTQNSRKNIIGNVKVSTFKKENDVDIDKLSSSYAKNFLKDLEAWKGPKRAMDDNRSYYIPYYFSYFFQIERAYKNIEKILNKHFDGYIIVVNNTVRKFVIPVAQVVKEIWQGFGCEAVIDDSLTTERTHVGSINPRAVGFKARHMEYAIRISRG